MLRVICCVVEWRYWWKPAPCRALLSFCRLHSYWQEVWHDVRAAFNNTTWKKKEEKKELSLLKALLYHIPVSPVPPAGPKQRQKFSEFWMLSISQWISSWAYAFRGAGHLSSLPHLCSLFYDVDLFKKIPCAHFSLGMCSVTVLHLNFSLIPGCKHAINRVLLLNTRHSSRVTA